MEQILFYFIFLFVCFYEIKVEEDVPASSHSIVVYKQLGLCNSTPFPHGFDNI